MADRAISALPTASTLTASDLFVLSQSNQAKNTTWQVIIGYLTTALDGHGGIQSITKTSTSGIVDTYTVTLADTTTYTFTVTNGDAVSTITQYYAVSTSNTTAPETWYTTMQTMTTTNKYLWSYFHYAFDSGNTLDSTPSVVGVYGDTGQAWYVHIKYASQQPTQDSDMGDVPDDWIGIYSGTSQTAPTTYTSYDWFEYKGEKGDTGDASAITSQSVTYMESDSGTVVPSGSWTTTIPSVAQGNFLWTRTILEFNDGTDVTSYSVARYGVDGLGSVISVNNVGPDGSGNVAIDASDIPTDDNTSVQARISGLETLAGDGDLDTTAQNLTDACNELKNGKVNKSGDTMTGDLTIRTDSAHILAQLTDVTVGTAPSANTGGYIDFSDSTGDQTIGRYSATYGANKSSYATMMTRNRVSGSNVDNYVRLRVGSDGSRTVEIPDAAPWISALGIGTVKTGTNATSLSLPNGTTTSISSLSLTAGTYLLCGGFTITPSLPGTVCAGYLTTTSTIVGTTVRFDGASGGGYNAAMIVSPTATTTYYLKAYQGSSSTATISAANVSLKAIRIC